MTLNEQNGQRNTGVNLELRDLIASLQSNLNNVPATLKQLLTDHAAQWHYLGWIRPSESLAGMHSCAA